MTTKFINTLDRRENILEWSKSGTINMAPCISETSLAFSLKHVMRLESELNRLKMDAYVEGDLYPWFFEKSFDI